MTTWEPVALTLATEPQLGGRWTSLRGGGREWLWSNPDPLVRRARGRVRPGDAFVDAGGVEECLPTVRGTPDHGGVWSRPWTGEHTTAPIQVDVDLHQDGRVVSGVLRRTIRETDGVVTVDYLVTGPPGATFLHAVHALLELSPQARLVIHGDVDAVVLDEPVPGDTKPMSWPSGLDRLGPDDGSATCAILRGCSVADVVDGEDRLSMNWSADDPSRCSLMLWRNLSGWPVGAPYSSIGIEPMVGRVADWDHGRVHDLAQLGAGGTFVWSLSMTAARRANPVSSVQR